MIMVICFFYDMILGLIIVLMLLVISKINSNIYFLLLL